VTVVQVEGEVDLSTAPRLDAALAAAIDRGVPTIVDLSSTTFMDSSGFRVVHEATDRLRLALVVPPDSILDRSVRLAGLHEIVPVCADRSGAFAELRD
jgi:anti-sigma B factor antagonist